MKLAERHLLNGNVWHNSDDVSVLELTHLRLAGQSELCVVVCTNIAQFQCPTKLSTKPVAAVAAQQHVVESHSAPEYESQCLHRRTYIRLAPKRGCPKVSHVVRNPHGIEIILEKGDSDIRETQDDLVRMELGNCCQHVGFHKPAISERNFQGGRDCAADGEPAKVGTKFP